MSEMTKNPLVETVKALLQSARASVVATVNTTMVRTYFEIGRNIVEHEQKGEARAGYGEETLKQLSAELTREFGRGFSVTNLKQMRTFFVQYAKGQTLSDESRKHPLETIQWG